MNRFYKIYFVALFLIIGMELNAQQWGNALSFDGSTKQFLKTVGNVNGQSDTITLEAWINWAGSNGKVQLIASNGLNAPVTGASNGYLLSLFNNNTIALLVMGQGWIQTSETVTQGVWTHIAAVRDNGTWKIFKNGTQISITAGNSSWAPNTPSGSFYVGGFGNESAIDLTGYEYTFNGKIDEVRLSNVVRYSNSFTRPEEPFTNDINTVALYHFNEGTGLTAADSSSGGNDLNFVSSHVAHTPSPEIWGNGFKFIGNKLESIYSTHSSDNQINNLTLEAWVNWGGPTGGAQLIASNGLNGGPWGSSNKGYSLALYPNNTLAILINGQAWIQTNETLTQGVWTHIAAVRENFY